MISSSALRWWALFECQLGIPWLTQSKGKRKLASASPCTPTTTPTPIHTHLESLRAAREVLAGEAPVEDGDWTRQHAFDRARCQVLVDVMWCVAVRFDKEWRCCIRLQLSNPIKTQAAPGTRKHSQTPSNPPPRPAPAHLCHLELPHRHRRHKLHVPRDDGGAHVAGAVGLHPPVLREHHAGQLHACRVGCGLVL